MYGVKGDRFPVAPGQVWAVGEHLIGCGDLEGGDGERFLALAARRTGRAPSLFYADPPWSPAFITRFRQGAGVAQTPEHTVQSVVQRIVRLSYPHPVFFEMGTTYGLPQVHRWVFDLGLKYPGTTWEECWPIKYSGKPAQLFLFGAPQPPPANFAGLDDALTPGVAMECYSEPGEVVVDPCLGLGCTARHAQRLGRACWGLELHPRRCSSALADLERMTKLTPTLVGVLEDG